MLADHQAYLKEHAGHEGTHAAMALIILTSLIVSQFAILYWKQKHLASFQFVGLIGLWLIPPFLALRAGNWRYLGIWTLFSIANSWIVYKALFQKPLQSYVPKLVYKWYSVIHKVSYGVGLVGYVLILLCFLGVLRVFLGLSDEQDAEVFGVGLIILFYGLYFGVLGRDFVVTISDKMAVSMGYYNPSGFPNKHLRQSVCAICGDDTSDTFVKTEGIKITTLVCSHVFHENCIRGWCILGKKDMCPYCKEKVDLKSFRGDNPWDTQQHLYLALLDAMRYLLVWQPLIFMTLHLVFNVLGMK